MVPLVFDSTLDLMLFSNSEIINKKYCKQDFEAKKLKVLRMF